MYTDHRSVDWPTVLDSDEMDKFLPIKSSWSLLLVLALTARCICSEELNLESTYNESLESLNSIFDTEHKLDSDGISSEHLDRPNSEVVGADEDLSSHLDTSFKKGGDENDVEILNENLKSEDVDNDVAYEQDVLKESIVEIDSPSSELPFSDEDKPASPDCENSLDIEGNENGGDVVTLGEHIKDFGDGGEMSLPLVNDRQDGDTNVVDTSPGDVKEADPEIPKHKHRVFPLLYTFRTLFTSFLAEFTDGQSSDTSRNMSTSSPDNMTSSELLDKGKNETSNGTDSTKKTRFQCAPKNISENATGVVKIVNSTELLDILNLSKKQKVSLCVLVLFYAPWCHFCAQTAPHYNALARAFPNLDVLAVDTSHFSYLNARFGTVAVPNIMLFHSRSAVRFNHSVRVLDNFVDFVTNNTGLTPNSSFCLEPFDEFGPLPSTVVRGTDWLLCLAWAFVLSCSGYGFVKSNYGQGLITRLRVLWQEHQHIE